MLLCCLKKMKGANKQFGLDSFISCAAMFKMTTAKKQPFICQRLSNVDGRFFALLGVYIFFFTSATKLHFFLGVFLHFIIGADTFLSQKILIFCRCKRVFFWASWIRTMLFRFWPLFYGNG